jgi:hypothetical protein
LWTPGREEAGRKERLERERRVRGRVCEAARAWAIARGLCDADGYFLAMRETKMGNKYDGGDRWMTGQCDLGCKSFISKGSVEFQSLFDSVSARKRPDLEKVGGICQLVAWKFLYRKPDGFSRLKAAKKCHFFTEAQSGA